MKRDVGVYREIQVFDFDRKKWCPFVICSKFEMRSSAELVRAFYRGYAGKFRWRQFGFSRWHVSYV